MPVEFRAEISRQRHVEHVCAQAFIPFKKKTSLSSLQDDRDTEIPVYQSEETFVDYTGQWSVGRKVDWKVKDAERVSSVTQVNLIFPLSGFFSSVPEGKERKNFLQLFNFSL